MAHNRSAILHEGLYDVEPPLCLSSLREHDISVRAQVKGDLVPRQGLLLLGFTLPFPLGLYGGLVTTTSTFGPL
jgi:hypothetical protein